MLQTANHQKNKPEFRVATIFQSFHFQKEELVIHTKNQVTNTQENTNIAIVMTLSTPR